jgi:hypothetical protein
MAANLNINDEGAPTGGRGIDNLSTEPRLRDEAIALIGKIDDTSKVLRGRAKNSQYESKNLHVDALTIGNKSFPYKIEVQRKKGTKNTVAVCIAASSATEGSIQAALLASLGNQHTWSAR